jgi:hypothetical protein
MGQGSPTPQGQRAQSHNGLRQTVRKALLHRYRNGNKPRLAAAGKNQ